ncbi:hypothetical protein Tcan_04864 [Toxocara canis]|uniref:MADF domain-containing protein n=1 Tax=Toxocara canis TaxID=6265 RepID=A0A0B2VKG4_TOXCA|nr:hypothetical protein Tcan_04864 [Toxocara canis]
MDQIEASGGPEAILELISMIRQDSRLWDRNSPNFITHYDVKIDRFSSIANRLNLPGVNGETVTSAWRELSEKYRRRLYDGKRRNGTTSWPFFEPMSFLRDQYEQARWHRTTPSTRTAQSPPPANVAQLVNTILNAHAAAEAEAAALAYSEPSYERTCAVPIAEEATPPEQKVDPTVPCTNMVNGVTEKVISDVPSQELTEKQELMNAAFRLFSAQQMKNGAKCNGDGMMASPSCAEAIIDVESTVEQQQQPQQRASSSSPSNEVLNPQMTSTGGGAVGGAAQTGRRKTRSRFSAYSKSKHSHTHKQVAAVPAAMGNTAFGCEMSPQYASVANPNEPQSDEAKTTSCHASIADLATSNSSPIPQQQPVDCASKWENVGRVWIDMMKTVRSPQLALAAHKFVTNTLFAVLEADHQLMGADPTTTRVRIRENAPQIEITMHQ